MDVDYNHCCRAEELARNSRNQMKEEQEMAFREAQLRDQEREVMIKEQEEEQKLQEQIAEAKRRSEVEAKWVESNKTYSFCIEILTILQGSSRG